MTAAIINRLKTGSVKRVVLFGDSGKLPKAPYAVVKSETGTGENRHFRIIVHRNQGEQDLIEDYLFNELPVLLGRRVWLTDRNGGRFRLLSGEVWTEPVANGDGTISMERVFILPMRLT